MSRLHTALAVAFLAVVPLTPLALSIYAKAASVDRAAIVAANERVLRSVTHMPGARRVSEHTYAIPRWGNEGDLVPTSGYRTELFLLLPRAATAAAIDADYRRAIAAWRARGVTIEIAVVGLHPRTYGVYVSQ